MRCGALTLCHYSIICDNSYPPYQPQPATSLTRLRSLNEKGRRDAQGSIAAIEPARLLRRIEFGEAALTGIETQHRKESPHPTAAMIS